MFVQTEQNQRPKAADMFVITILEGLQNATDIKFYIAEKVENAVIEMLKDVFC